MKPVHPRTYDEDDWPVHQPPAPEAPIPGIHHYAGCNPDRPRVQPDGTCEECGARACPECGKGGESVSCPDCGRGKIHYLQSCCACGLSWDALEDAAWFWKEKIAT